MVGQEYRINELMDQKWVPATDTVKNRSCTKELKSDISCHTSERSVHWLAIRQQSRKRKAVTVFGQNWDKSLLRDALQEMMHFWSIAKILAFSGNIVWTLFPVWWTVMLARSVEICLSPFWLVEMICVCKQFEPPLPSHLAGVITFGFAPHFQQ